MIAYFLYSMLLSGFVYPVIVHAIWNSRGFLCSHAKEPLFGVGMNDFAGSGVVHFTGGMVSLFATTVLGPRRGRFHDEDGRKLDKPREFPGQSVSLQVSPQVICEASPFAVTHASSASFLDRCLERWYFGSVGTVSMRDRRCP